MDSDMGKLFVGGISWDTNEERLRDHFKRYGDVVEAVIIKDRATGRARGFGFVAFADPAVSERVLLEKHTIDGRVVDAKRAVPRDDNRNNSSTSTHGSPSPARTKKIFVGGLASTVTENDFKKHFDQFGTITDAVVMYDHSTQRPRGFGFITFDSEDAVDKVLLKTFHELNGKLVEVKRAVPKELSPGPTVRSSIGGYSYSLSRVGNFSSSFAQGLSLSSIGGYEMRMDGRTGPVASWRNNFPHFGSNSYGVGMNFEPGMSSNWGGNMNYNYSLGQGRLLNPYYSGNPSRYASPMRYRSGNSGAGPGFTSPIHNAWDNGGLIYDSNSSGSNSFPSSGSANFSGFGNSGFNWGRSTSLMLADVGRSGSGYNRGSHVYGNGENSYRNVENSYGNGENRYGIGDSSFVTNSVNGGSSSSFSPTNALYDGAYADLYGGASIYGHSTGRSIRNELDSSSSFAYGLVDAAPDVIDKDSSDSLGSYGVTNRQASRGIAA